MPSYDPADDELGDADPGLDDLHESAQLAQAEEEDEYFGSRKDYDDRDEEAFLAFLEAEGRPLPALEPAAAAEPPHEWGCHAQPPF